MTQRELEKRIEIAKRDGDIEIHWVEDGFTSLPENIGSLCNLTKLNLHSNKLTSLPNSIGNLSNLTHLNLSHNKLVKLPESMGNLSNLTHLGLNNNQLMSLPESIGNPHSALQLLRHILVTKTRQFDDTTDRNSLIAVTQN